MLGEPVDEPFDAELPQRLYRHDPLLVLLRNKLHLPAGWCAIGTALVATAVLLGGSVLAGVENLDEDLGITLLQSVVIMPTGVVIYMLLPDALADLFTTLRRNGVVGNPLRSVYDSYTAFERELIARVDSRWWVAIAVLGVGLYWLYRLVANVPNDLTRHADPQIRLLLRLAMLIAYSGALYGAFVSVPRFLIGLVYTKRLFQSFEIRVNPLHPDGSAGMAAIGRMLMLGVLVATAIGAAAVVMALARRNVFSRPEVWVLIAIYLISLPSLFLGWLWMPHRAMLAARDEALAPLALEFLRSLPAALPSAHEGAATIKANTDRLAEIKRQYELLLDTFPVWPIRTGTLNRLALTSLLPLISSLLASLVPLIWNR